ncbi:MAG: NifU family protein [Acidobacteriota bacterium]|nr:NifU family protein [Acidobacteriota bacterium]
MSEKPSQKGIRRIEELIHKFESVKDPSTREDARKLVQALMDFHGSGIERMMEIVADFEGPDATIFDVWGRDELVSSLLLLYDLHPLDVETRVKAALDKVRPILRAQSSNVYLVGIEDGVVQLRFEGKSAPNLKSSIEEEIYKTAADVTDIRIEGLAPEKSNVNGLVQLQI